jgi:SAM-dependent methyltransferase
VFVSDPSFSAVRALSFGTVADSYDRFRPGPPVAAVDWVLPSSAVDVLDLGAGTGALTRMLLPRAGSKVVAAEPDDRMRAVLARRSPGALAVGARGEALPFADGGFDAVIVSSAWHWMDPAVTVPEVARVLRPGGCLGVLWNGPARNLDWVSELLGRRRSDRAAELIAGWEPSRRRRHRFELPPGSPFTHPETTVIEWSTPMSSDQLVGLAGTFSAVITQDAAERSELLAGVRRRASVGTTVELPMGCRCWRASRLEMTI